MNLTVISTIMVLLIVAAAFQKKVPMWIVLIAVPILAALCLGMPITEISGAIVDKCNETMKSAGYLLLFALIYFTMLTESGMFDTIVGAVLKPFGAKMNIFVLLVITTALGLLCALTSQISGTMLILFPILLPIFKKFNVKREYAFILVQTALAVMMWLPWSAGIVNVSVVLGCEATELSAAASKAAICMVPAIIFQWVYMALRQKKQYGSFTLVEIETEDAAASKKEKPLARPKMFVPNLIVFLILMVALLKFKIPAYMVFMVGSIYMILVNYPKDYNVLVEKAGKSFMGLFMFMIGISVYLAVFTSAGMTEAMGTLLTTLVPDFLARYLHVIMLAICVICVRYVPNRVFTLLYPLLVAVGATFGFNGLGMIAPFIINLTLATGSTPMNAVNFLGCSLLELDPDTYFNTAVPIQTITNLIAIATGMILGIIPL